MSPSVDAGVSQAGGSLGTYTGLLAPTTPFHVVVAARRRFPSCVADPFFRKLGGSGFATRARVKFWMLLQPTARRQGGNQPSSCSTAWLIRVKQKQAKRLCPLKGVEKNQKVPVEPFLVLLPCDRVAPAES